MAFNWAIDEGNEILGTEFECRVITVLVAHFLELDWYGSQAWRKIKLFKKRLYQIETFN